MKIQGLALVLTAINLVLLFLILTQVRSTVAQDISPILRARMLELVDDRGQVRARLTAESERALHLFDKNGIIRVKLGAGENGSGLVLSDGTSEAGVHLLARRIGTAALPNTTSITLKGADGQQRVIRP